MSKQFMDFAPRRATGTKVAAKTKVVGGAKMVTKQPVAKATLVKPAVKRSVTGVRKTGLVSGAKQRPVARAKQSVMMAKRVTPKTMNSASVTVQKSGSLSVKKEPKLGVIEDLNPKFVNTNVPKRPLSQASHFKTQKTGVMAAKAKKVGVRGATTVEKPVENSKKKVVSSVYSAPKSPFINQDKIQKRPLSKNVYQRKAPVPKEEPKGPVTIISQPEKQAHVGLIVTIILTIILGAAAGTVAFLLLPK